MEERIKKEIKTLFNDIKKLEKDRTRIVKGIVKDRGTIIIERIMDEEFQIKKKLGILTALLKILLNIDFFDVRIWDLGRKTIHLSYFKSYPEDDDCGTIYYKKYKVL